MTTVSVTNFRKNIFSLLSETISHNAPLHVITKEGSAVVLSEEDYNALQETLYISSVPGLRDTIVEAMDTPIEDCINEKLVVQVGQKTKHQAKIKMVYLTRLGFGLELAA
ncbi:MAG: type II toxin-antitoxin system Phd/YefM family antitoxin [Coriobacteriales bacterium]|jgi:PHD/YefM family antitoxin component YafN of YafNO toxin-antitoxin module|nr:type II toxin-antitoxin system Phd/YefM family antitoxin [Coriobacteriales bacterium]